MIVVRLYLKDIDYYTIVDTAMPFIEKGLSDKDSIALEVVKKMISNHGKPTGLSKLLVSVLPNKDSLAASLLPHFDEVLIEYMNELMKKNNIAAAVKKISLKPIERSQGKLLRIEVIVDDIDYEQTAVNLAPVILKKLKEQEGKAGKLAGLLMGQNDLPGNILKAAIGAIPKQQRDELLADILVEYRQELTGTLNDLVTKNNMKAEITDMKIINM